MKTIICVAIISALVSSCSTKRLTTSAAAENSYRDKLTLKGETPDLPAPESIYYDENEKVLFVSMQAGTLPGDGAIGKLTLDGTVITKEFAVGLNDPKGITVAKGKLYAGDIKELVEVDLTTGRILNKYTHEKVQFLNDVTADDKGNVYVSDMFTSSIFKLDANKHFTEWYSSPQLENPNGLLVVGQTMYIAGWGDFTDSQPTQAPPGRFQKMDMSTKKITRITKEVLGNLDGVQLKDSNSFFVSNWKLGKLYTITKDGQIKEHLSLGKGMGDILYIPGRKLLAIPMKFANKVVFYNVE